MTCFNSAAASSPCSVPALRRVAVTLAISLGICLGLGLTEPAARAQSQLSTTLDAPASQAASAANAESIKAPETSASGSKASSSEAANPYGLAALWLQGDWVAKGCLLL